LAGWVGGPVAELVGRVGWAGRPVGWMGAGWLADWGGLVGWLAGLLAGLLAVAAWLLGHLAGWVAHSWHVKSVWIYAYMRILHTSE